MSGQALRVKAVTTTNDTAPVGLYRKSHSIPDSLRKTERL